MSEKLQKQHFQFEALLGEGSFGQVFLVKRNKDGKQFVIKQQTSSPDNILVNKMVAAEIQCLQILRHPNIISYYGAWQESGHFHILLEYAAHGTLKDLLDKRVNSPLSEKDSLYLFAQIVLGVHHIHSKHIMHRDLKPENIMLTGRMGDIVKICDFGLSRGSHLSNKSHAGSFYYISPEMLKKESYDYKCDIWSMGVIFYEMLTNKLVFEAENMEKLREAICNEEQRCLFRTKVKISRDTQIIVYKMLLREPAKRPTTKLLLLNPTLVSYIAKVYLNLGRTYATPPHAFGMEIFQPFLKPLNDKSQ